MPNNHLLFLVNSLEQIFAGCSSPLNLHQRWVLESILETNESYSVIIFLSYIPMIDRGCSHPEALGYSVSLVGTQLMLIVNIVLLLSTVVECTVAPNNVFSLLC